MDKATIDKYVVCPSCPTLANQWRRLDSQLAIAEQKAHLLSGKIGFDYQQADVVEAINQHGQVHGLTFEQIRWGKAQADDGYLRQGLNIELQGEYHAIGQFMAALTTLDYLIVFEQVTWQRTAPNSSRLKWYALAYLYQPGKDES